jgi:hypothetical protein
MFASAFKLRDAHVPEFGFDLLRVHLWIDHFALFPACSGD